MSDDPIAARFRVLRTPVDPPSEFSERLFAVLVDDIDFASGTVRRPSFRARLRMAWRVTASQRRVAWTLVATALALALLLSLALAGAKLPPVELLQRSQALYRDPPPFDMTVTLPTLTIRYRYDGAGRLRGDVLGGATATRQIGTFVFDGRAYHEFDARGRYLGAFGIRSGPDGPAYESALLGPFSGTVDEASSPLSPFPLTWTVPGTFRASPPLVGCMGVSDQPSETVAGRKTRRLACPDEGADYWLDDQSSMVLKVQRGTDVYTATSVDLRPDLPASLFEVPVGPNGEAPLTYGPLAAGRYFTAHFAPTMTFDLGDEWFGAFDRASDGRVEHPSYVITFVRILRVIDPESGAAQPFQGDANDFIAWLRAHPKLTVGEPSPISVPGATGQWVEVAVDPAAELEACENTQEFRCLFVLQLEVGHLQQNPSQVCDYVVLDMRPSPVLLEICGDAAGRALGIESLPEIVAFPFA